MRMTRHDECRATQAQEERTNAKFSQIRSDGDIDVLQVPAVDAQCQARSPARDRSRAMLAAQQLLVTPERPCNAFEADSATRNSHHTEGETTQPAVVTARGC